MCVCVCVLIELFRTCCNFVHLYSVYAVSLIHVLNLAFANIPIGVHSLFAFAALSILCFLTSSALKATVTSILPLEASVAGFVNFIITDILFGMIKFIPVKDKRTGQTKHYGVGTYLHMPASHRFDLKARAAVKRGIQTAQLATAFGAFYPILGGLFFQSGIIIQACLIPVFFIFRATFEYGADAIVSHTFGSDCMPAMNFWGVIMHETCLSMMLTSIKHPLVFVSLVLSDVLENSFCLWSLAINAKKSLNRVTPDEIPVARRSFSRRSTNVVSLLQDPENLSDEGTALFIAATLLQREMVETLVPIQASAILSFLYFLDVKSNSVVSGWSEADWIQSMIYIGVDLLVELVVFAGTILALSQIYPKFSAYRILRGLLRMHWIEMAAMSICIWIGMLWLQSTYGGTDMTLKFPWLDCKDEVNSTWLGGFDWEC